MTRNRIIELFAMSILAALLSACASPPPAALPAPVAQSLPDNPEVVVRQTQMHFRLASGLYLCELGQRVDVQRDAENAKLILINWKGKRQTLRRYDSTSGLPRYENRQEGLLWIDLPWKGVLMDSNSGRPLANECKARA